MTDAAGLAETHTSVVVFFGERAYKVLKPLATDVLDYSTVERRHEACRREVDLNRRIAPDVYEGVAEVRGEQGEVLDHLVVMRRLPADRRLAHVVGQEEATSEVRAVAHQVADFHRDARRAPEIDAVATPEGLRARWEDDLDGAAEFSPRWLPGPLLDEVRTLAHAYLAGRAPLLERRVHEGRICDGHGDLLADDVFCLADGPRIIDCLAFADELRWGDVLADVAFLAMDLERLGRPDLATLLLGEHAARLGDVAPSSLVHLYVAQRALVRAKVGALRGEQGDEQVGAAAADLLGLAADHLRRAEVLLVLVGGAPGTGKSTLARGLADELGATLLRSDVVRKEQAGVAEHADLHDEPDAGAYAPEAVGRTYDALLAQAERHLGLGERVVLDASWSSEDRRRAAREVAHRTSSSLVELRTHVPVEVATERVARRRAEGTDASDATPEVAALLAERFEPWPDAVVVDTTGEVATSLAQALAAVGPPGSADG